MYAALWVVVLATIGSGFFSLLSFSLRSLSRSKLEEAFTGGRGRVRLVRLDAMLESLRLGCTLCRTIASLVLVAGMIELIQPAAWWGIVGAIAASAGLLAVFGVAIPHAWATHAAEKIVAATYPVLVVLRIVLAPLTIIMRAFDVPIRRLAGLEDESDQPGDEAKNEILLAASNGAAEGSVDRSEVEMIESVMEFRTTDAAEIMTPRTDMFALAEETPLGQAAQEIHDAGFSRAPIYQNSLDNITGMLYAKDLLAHASKEPGQTSLAEIARPCFFVPETITLDDLLREFKARKVHLAVVLDEYGGTAGLVSIEDVLEEIVGDISDEYDQARDEQVRRINETTVEVDGRLRIDELNDLLDIELPEDEDYDTVAGYAAAVLGYIPSADETFDAPQANFTVLEADPRRIVKLRVERIATESGEE